MSSQKLKKEIEKAVDHVKTCPKCLSRTILKNLEMMGVDTEVATDALAMSWEIMRDAEKFSAAVRGEETHEVLQ